MRGRPVEARAKAIGVQNARSAGALPCLSLRPVCRDDEETKAGYYPHPLMVPLADTNFNQIVADYSTAAHDVWGVQPYRGATFGDLFRTFISEKPLLVSEYGMDAYNDVILSDDNVDCLTIVCFVLLRKRVYTPAMMKVRAGGSDVAAARGASRGRVLLHFILAGGGSASSPLSLARVL